MELGLVRNGITLDIRVQGVQKKLGFTFQKAWKTTLNSMMRFRMTYYRRFAGR